MTIVIVGAGLAGLSAACEAATTAPKGRPVVVLDSHDLGGRARCSDVEGFTFNAGPRALYRRGAAHRMLTKFSITPTGGTPATNDSYALLGDDLYRLPGNAVLLLKSKMLGLRDKAQAARLLGGLAQTNPSDHGTQSAAHWLEHLRPKVRALVQTLVRLTTYCADMDSLSADAAIGQLQIALGAGVLYLDGGFQRLVDQLASRARHLGVDIRADVAVAGVARAAGNIDVTLTDGSTIQAQSAVVAVGGPRSVRSLLTGAPHWHLGPAVESACWELGTSRLPDVPIVLGIDQPLYLSTHCPPARLAPAGQFVVHTMRSFTSHDQPSADAIRAQLSAFAARVGLSASTIVAGRYLHKMMVTGGVPTAAAGGLPGRPAVDATGIDGVFIAGDWVGPEGMLADAAMASGVAAGSRAARRAELFVS